MSIERKLMDLVRRSNAARPGMTGQCEVSACYIQDPDPTKSRCIGPGVTKKQCDEVGGRFARVSRSVEGHQSGCPSVGDLCKSLMIQPPEMD